MADEDKMDFRIHMGIFCYTKMPFGLKKASATYQRLINRIFEEEIGHSMEC